MDVHLIVEVGGELDRVAGPEVLRPVTHEQGVQAFVGGTLATAHRVEATGREAGLRDGVGLAPPLTHWRTSGRSLAKRVSVAEPYSSPNTPHQYQRRSWARTPSLSAFWPRTAKMAARGTSWVRYGRSFGVKKYWLTSSLPASSYPGRDVPPPLVVVEAQSEDVLALAAHRRSSGVVFAVGRGGSLIPEPPHLVGGEQA